MRLRRASVIAALSLLASAATAYAECAWVVWSYGFVAGEDVYRIETAHPSLRECEDDLNIFAESLKKNGYRLSGGGYVPGSRRLMGQKGTKALSYLCVPDTVDPRGPKGK